MTTDLKPENLLYKTRDPDSNLILADFGIAKALQSKDEALMSMAGSYGYAAPEILLQTGHSFPADMWSLGYPHFLSRLSQCHYLYPFMRLFAI